MLNFEKQMQYALESGRTVDYRENAKTLWDCEFDFEEFGHRVVLNDGMVMGFEY